MTKYTPRPPKLCDLDPSNWEHQDLARALKVARCGSLCTHGHPWLLHGVLCADGRVRCKVCALKYTNDGRRRRVALAKLAKGQP